jgi:nucleotide-binding universal stress UspA family protein
MTGSLIVGMDDTDDSRDALARAAEWARAAGLRLVVVHVRHIPVLAEMSPMTIGPARQNLDVIEAAARRAAEDVLQGTGVNWEFVVRSGDPAHELMAMTADRPAMAIVVGGRPRRAALSGLGRSAPLSSTDSTAPCLSSATVTKRGTPASASGPPSGRRHLSPPASQVGEHHAVVRSDLR